MRKPKKKTETEDMTMTVEQYIRYIETRMEDIKQAPWSQWTVFMPTKRWLS